jgi:acyl-CoA synthetase (AMP-forming)/AMP-acid ligase II
MVTDLVSLLCRQAESKPQQTAYIFLERGETEAARLTFLELDRRARAIAARLQAMKLADQRALLLYPPGLDYVEAFFACLYGGVVAVPAYPPSRQHLQRLLAVIKDAAPAVVMTTTELKAKLQDRVQEVGLEQDIFWLATNTLANEAAVRWQKPALTAASLALLQYTSGSTGNPKGVMVSHGNLLANQAAIQQSFGHTAQSTVVGWLPLYHDMGLIGNLLRV